MIRTSGQPEVQYFISRTLLYRQKSGDEHRWVSASPRSLSIC